jgi:hypothetical protein
MNEWHLYDPIVQCVIEKLDYSDLVSMMTVNKKISRIVKKHIENTSGYFVLTMQREDEYMEEYVTYFYESLKQLMFDIPPRCKYCIYMDLYNEDPYKYNNEYNCSCKATYISIDQFKLINYETNSRENVEKIIWNAWVPKEYIERNIWSSDKDVAQLYTYNRKSVNYLLYGIPLIPDTMKHGVPWKYIDSYNTFKYDKIYNEHGSTFKNNFNKSATNDHLDYICMGQLRIWKDGKIRLKRYIIAKGEYIREYMYIGTDWIPGNLEL